MRVVIEITDDGQGGVLVKDTAYALPDEKYTAALDLGRWVTAAARGMLTLAQENQCRFANPKGRA